MFFEVVPREIYDWFLFPIDGIIGEVRMVAEVGDGNSHHSVIGNFFLEVCGCHLKLLWSVPIHFWCFIGIVCEIKCGFVIIDFVLQIVDVDVRVLEVLK